MQSRDNGNAVVAKFTEGNAIENLEGLAEKQGIDSAVIVSGIGMLKNAVIGYFNGKEYITEKLDEPAELVSMQGNIGRDAEGNVICHIHVALAPSDHRLVGGHLLGGEVNVVNEIVLERLDGIKITRRKNADGLMEMYLE
ncbi:MAG: DUF296 domain-containing protein [Thermoplasmata archaeon]|nr:DUF296 domain-containing protein [Thermoplasmata archaeon]